MKKQKFLSTGKKVKQLLSRELKVVKGGADIIIEDDIVS